MQEENCRNFNKKQKKKNDRFEQMSRTLERKISIRSTKEKLIKKGVLTPDGTDKDQDSKINDSVHQNHIPQNNGFGPESGMSETEKQHNSPSVTYTSSFCFRNLQHRCGYQLWFSYRTIVISESCHACETQCFPVESSGCRRGAFT
ncbi:phosphatase and actin regulator 2 [Trichonephila clavipes]|uniref:Phosphatase and actin regulator 2 n=1 Tax=Trichonephila clavipes TaxID=2585209 RepID=A0A8X6VP97_TRICX|nr:phosphatase and actin regulator 2 [Trichonephila clavipes]